MDVELAAAQSLFVDGKPELAVLQQGRTRIVPVPQAKDVHSEEKILDE